MYLNTNCNKFLIFGQQFLHYGFSVVLHFGFCYIYLSITYQAKHLVTIWVRYYILFFFFLITFWADVTFGVIVTDQAYTHLETLTYR